MELNKIYFGDNLELLKQLKDNSIDSCVSDFPYNLGFMGKKWDTIDNYYQWCYDRAKELYRALKPGAYCLIFSGTRTQHRMVCGFEDAGFKIKDQIMWVYGQGFPKNYNISKGFDKKAGVKRKIVGTKQHSKKGFQDNLYAKDPANRNNTKVFGYGEEQITTPSTDLAKQWDGWGTSLKPTHEPIMMAQKPIEKNYCYNVEKWGVGGLYIDGNRIELDGEVVPINKLKNWSGFGQEKRPDYKPTINKKGRWPANTIFDEEAGRMLDQQSGFSKSTIGKPRGTYKKGMFANSKFNKVGTEHNDKGGASRFYYCAKANKKDRTENGQIENTHATVKPTSLMKHLIKLVTPPNGINLDICEGSGSSAKACLQLRKDGYAVSHIGFENNLESYKIALKRIELNK